MSTAIKVVLGVLVAIVILLAGALVVVDAKFEVVRGSPEIAYETIVNPNTRIQIVAQVPLAKDVIKQRFMKDIPVPDWVIPKALPHRAAVLVVPDNAVGMMDFILLVNDQRLGPIIIDRANQYRLPRPFDSWFQNSAMVRKRRGLLEMKGSGIMDALMISKVRSQWDTTKTLEPLPVEGGHMVEVVLDNRDGGALTIIASLIGTQGIDVSGMLDEGRLDMLASIASIRIQADLLGEDTLKLRLVIECAPERDPTEAQVLGGIIQMVPGQLRTLLNIPIEGGSSVRGRKIEANYTIPNITSVAASVRAMAPMLSSVL